MWFPQRSLSKKKSVTSFGSYDPFYIIMFKITALLGQFTDINRNLDSKITGNTILDSGPMGFSCHVSRYLTIYSKFGIYTFQLQELNIINMLVIFTLLLLTLASNFSGKPVFGLVSIRHRVKFYRINF